MGLENEQWEMITYNFIGHISVLDILRNRIVSGKVHVDKWGFLVLFFNIRNILIMFRKELTKRVTYKKRLKKT